MLRVEKLSRAFAAATALLALLCLSNRDAAMPDEVPDEPSVVVPEYIEVGDLWIRNRRCSTAHGDCISSATLKCVTFTEVIEGVPIVFCVEAGL